MIIHTADNNVNLVKNNCASKDSVSSKVIQLTNRSVSHLRILSMTAVLFSRKVANVMCFQVESVSYLDDVGAVVTDQNKNRFRNYTQKLR